MPLNVGYLFLVGSNILLLIVVQQRVVIWEFSQKMSACPSAPSSWISVGQVLIIIPVSTGEGKDKGVAGCTKHDHPGALSRGILLEPAVVIQAP